MMAPSFYFLTSVFYLPREISFPIASPKVEKILIL